MNCPKCGSGDYHATKYDEIADSVLRVCARCQYSHWYRWCGHEEKVKPTLIKKPSEDESPIVNPCNWTQERGS